MSVPLAEKSGRYAVQVEGLIGEGETTYVRYRADTGQQVGEPPGDRFRVLLGNACSLTLGLGENGLTVGRVKLAGAREAVLTAVVTPGPAAPDWLPERSEYLLFSGDAAQTVHMADRYIPLDGMATESESASTETAPLDRLAIAIGRSVARANAVLARSQADAGVALVAGLTVRVAAEQIELAQGRVIVSLAPPGRTGETQFIEFTMTTVPGATGEVGATESDRQSNVNPPTVEAQTTGQGNGQPVPTRTAVQTPSGVFRTRGTGNSGGRRSG